MKALPYVYKLTHKTTSQFYIGYREANTEPASEDLPKYQSSSTYVKELGFENFHYDIIAEFAYAQEAYDYENILIQESFDDPLCLNRHYQTSTDNRFRNPGPGTYSLTETQKAKLSAAVKGKKKKPWTEEQKAARSAAMKGKKQGPRSEEAKSNMRKPKQSKPPKSEDHKQKIRDALKGKKKSPESTAKANESRRKTREAKALALFEDFDESEVVL